MLKTLEKGATIGVFSPSYPITCDAPDSAVRAEAFITSNGYKVKRGRLWWKTNFPILAECDFSHCAPMLTIPIGFTAELDASAQTID